jgi:dynein heavy chain 1
MKRTKVGTDVSFWVAFKTNIRSYSESSPTTSLTYTLHLPPTPPVFSRLLATLSLIKKRPTLDATTPIADQLHFVLLSSNNNAAATGNGYDGTSDQLQTRSSSDEVAAPYEGLRSLVHFGVTPWFESYINSKQGKTIDVLAAGKKGAEAQMGERIRSLLAKEKTEGCAS